MSKYIELVCEHCGKKFLRLFKQYNSCHVIRKTKHNFCSSNCAAIFNNKNRPTSTKIKHVNCIKCNKEFDVVGTSPKKTCNECKPERNEFIPNQRQWISCLSD